MLRENGCIPGQREAARIPRSECVYARNTERIRSIRKEICITGKTPGHARCPAKESSSNKDNCTGKKRFRCKNDQTRRCKEGGNESFSKNDPGV